MGQQREACPSLAYLIFQLSPRVLVDPVTGAPATPSLQLLASLTAIEIEGLGPNDKHELEYEDLDTLRAVLCSWRPRPLSQYLNVSVSIHARPTRSTRENFFAFMDQFVRVVEENCPSSFLYSGIRFFGANMLTQRFTGQPPIIMAVAIYNLPRSVKDEEMVRRQFISDTEACFATLAELEEIQFNYKLGGKHRLRCHLAHFLHSSHVVHADLRFRSPVLPKQGIMVG